MGLEITRRGLFGVLGGLLLAAKTELAPRAIAEPTEQLWKEAKRLPSWPIVNTYVPYEYLCAETLRIVNEELKWLHLEQSVFEHSYSARLGDSFQVRERAMFVNYRTIDLLNYASVNLGQTNDLFERDRPFGHISKHMVKPAAYQLAEGVIQGIRRNGGGEYLVMARSRNAAAKVDRHIDAYNSDSGLALQLLAHREGVFGPETTVELRMLYGVG